MASVQDIKRRIRSVRTRGRSRARWSSSRPRKLRRAQARIEAMRPYAERMQELMVGVARASSSSAGCRCSSGASVQTVAILPLTGDRGLAGAFNAQILREAFAHERAPARGGHRGRAGSSPARRDVDAALPPLRGRPGVDRLQRQPALRATRRRSRTASPSSTPSRRSTASSSSTTTSSRRSPSASSRRRCCRSRSRCSKAEDDEQPQALLGDFIYEPEPEQILERLLPVYVETELYRALLESAASEQGARMTAMRNASKNAGELIDGLTLADEPRPPGRDHAGDPGGRRGRRRLTA